LLGWGIHGSIAGPWKNLTRIIEKLGVKNLRPTESTIPTGAGVYAKKGTTECVPHVQGEYTTRCH
jgi:hypothetical protein